MTLEQLEAEIKAIKKKCDDDIQKLRIEYLKGQVKYKAGDIVTDHNGSIIVEGLFRKISGLKQYGHFSLDIYYNDLDNTFVAKLSRIIFDKSYSDIHFRNVELFDSMLDAYNYLISISVKPK